MSSTKDNTTTIPMQTPEDIALPQSLLDLRTAALRKTSGYGIPTLALIDAEAWRLHSPSEDWLEWRGRWSATRLREMPLDISSGELIVGRPLLRDPNENEQAQITAVQHLLDSIPPYPGGDPGHFHPDYEKLFRSGIGGVLGEIKNRKEQASGDTRTMYNACEIAMQGFSDYVVRVADECDAKAGCAGEYADHWHNMADICRKVAIAPPDTFHEAIELMFLTMVALWFGDDHFLTTPGRMDQTLLRFYESDLAAGRITHERAFELICSLYIQCNMILYPGSALSVMVGGRDSQGRDVTNDLTYMCMDARLATHLVYPTIGIAWHEDTPIELTKHACRMIATGVGDPAFFNDELIIIGLRKHGVSESDSYNYMNSTCVEIKVAGASNMWVTQPYFNCPEAILHVMDMVADDTMPEPATFAEFCTAVKERLASTVRDAAVSLDKIWHDREERGCHPLASCLISDCLEKGLDYDRGGARYNWVENSFVGLANL
ncbi:pyruvate formate lyase family protein, partial [bacterium]|nr:pyruvate formate lyase family protein [bacterium]